MQGKTMADANITEDETPAKVDHPRPTLREFEGTVPVLFRRSYSQGVVPRNTSNSSSLEVQLRAVRTEAASRWRRRVNRDDNGQEKREEEGCRLHGENDGIGRNEAADRAMKLLLSEERKTNQTALSAEIIFSNTRKGTRLDQLINQRDISWEWRPCLIEDPWLDRYQREMNKMGDDVFYPLRKTDGYTTLVSILRSTKMGSAQITSVGSGDTDAVTVVELSFISNTGEKNQNQHKSTMQVDSANNETLRVLCDVHSSLEDMFTGEHVQGYTFTSRLAEGASSVIFLVEKDGERFVAKVSIYPYSKEDKRFKILKHEFRVMKKLEHPQIVKVYEYFVHREHGVIIMEYMDGGELWTYVENNWPLPPPILQLTLFEIFSAVRHIHKKGYTHMDIKTNNILMDSEGHVKLADFGGAKRYGIFHRKYKYNFFTPQFAPPERQQQERGISLTSRSKHYDIWSFGVVCYQLYTGQLPYSLSEGRRFLPKDIFTDTVTFPEDIERNMFLVLLIKQCMQIDPSERISPKEALLHPYFITLLNPCLGI